MLAEQDQDITHPLDFASNTVDVVFAEHVIEHVPFMGGVQFLRESFRILKSGGVCRIVCPMLDRLVTAELDDPSGREYMRNSILGNYTHEDELLRALGLDGINEEPRTFLFNSLYMKHGHRFIWSSDLMIKVMTAIGFNNARRYEPGEGSRAADCIERRRRGLYLGFDWREDVATGATPYDVEGFVVEGIK